MGASEGVSNITISSLSTKEVQEFGRFPGWCTSDLECVSCVESLDYFSIDLVVGAKKSKVFGYSGSLFAWIDRLLGAEDETINTVSDFARESEEFDRWGEFFDVEYDESCRGFESILVIWEFLT